MPDGLQVVHSKTMHAGQDGNFTVMLPAGARNPQFQLETDTYETITRSLAPTTAQGGLQTLDLNDQLGNATLVRMFISYGHDRVLPLITQPGTTTLQVFLEAGENSWGRLPPPHSFTLVPRDSGNSLYQSDKIDTSDLRGSLVVYHQIERGSVEWAHMGVGVVLGVASTLAWRKYRPDKGARSRRRS